MSSIALGAFYCGLIVLASLAGGLLPQLVQLTHRRLELLVSLVSGVMLGAAFLHLLPHAWIEWASWLEGQGGTDVAVSHEIVEPVLGWLLGGFLAMFLIERFFCFHHHEPPDPGEPGPGVRGRGDAGRHRHQLTWTGAAVGLSVHSLVAGIALGASLGVGASREATWAGFGVFLAIVLHKPFDALTLATLMAAGKRPRRTRHLANAIFGLMVPIGVGLFVLAAGGDQQPPHRLISAALAFSAGTFLCISLSDLLPELQFHQHDRIKLSLALVLGLLIAWATARLEARAHSGWADRVATPRVRVERAQALTRPGRWVSSTGHVAAQRSHRELHYPAPLRAGRGRRMSCNLPIGLALGGADCVEPSA